MAFKSFVLFVALATFISVHSFPAEEQIRRIAPGPGPAAPNGAVGPVPPAASQDLKTDSTYGYGYYYPYSYYYYPRYYGYGYGYPYYSYYGHYSWPYYR